MQSKETSHHKWELTIIEILNSDGWKLHPSWTKTEHYDAIGKTPKGFNFLPRICCMRGGAPVIVIFT